MADERKIFLKKVAEFNPEGWPIVGYSSRGLVNNLISESTSNNDLVLFVVTSQSPQKEHRGRLIALAEFGREVVDGFKFIGEKEANENLSPQNFKDGKFKWSHAVRITKVWMLTNPPLYSEVLKENKKEYDNHTYNSSYPLKEKDIKKVLALPKQEAPVGNVANRENITNENIISKSSAPSRGPTPYLGEKQGGEIKDGINYTYAFRFGNKAIWKIGYTQDLDKRLKDINAHIPHEILKEKWIHDLIQKWESADSAYNMEQEVLTLLHDKRTQGERVACSENEIGTAWAQAIVNCRKI